MNNQKNNENEHEHDSNNYYCDDYDGDEDKYLKSYTQNLVTCGNCGNVWDGYTQCNCYQLPCYSIEENTSSEDTPIDKPQEHILNEGIISENTNIETKN